MTQTRRDIQRSRLKARRYARNTRMMAIFAAVVALVGGGTLGWSAVSQQDGPAYACFTDASGSIVRYDPPGPQGAFAGWTEFQHGCGSGQHLRTAAGKPPTPTTPTTNPPTTTTTVKPPTTTTTTVPSGGSSLPPVAGYFNFLPPGAVLPSGQACAAQVHRSSWEPRPGNAVANKTAPVHPELLANFSQWTAKWNQTYRPRIDGAFTGTTDETMQWAACKWGWSDNLVRAQAIQESSWRQATAGDGGHSFGLLQIKYDFHPAGPAKGAVGSSWPNSQNSTAYAVDQALAEARGCYDGMSTYLGNTTGDVWGCLQSWFDGGWTPNGGSYANSVKNHLAQEAWLKAGF